MKGLLSFNPLFCIAKQRGTSHDLVVYFKADVRKSGGQYLTVVGMVKKVDLIERVLVMTSGQRILFDDTLGIESKLFEGRV